MANLWTVLLTPAFGAYLHSSNWRALGQPGRVRANWIWFWVTVVYLVVNLGSVLFRESAVVNWVLRWTSLVLLLGWYFTQGRFQSRFLNETLGDAYVRRSWGRPLLVGAVLAGAYVIAIYQLAALYRPDTDELAAHIKQGIIQKCEVEPGFQRATIHEVSLVHREGKVYTGFVDVTIDGQAERWPLEVVYDRGDISWKLQRPARR